MKKILPTLLAIWMFSSCSSSDSQEHSNSSIDFKTFETPIPYNGDWICEDYFNSIQEYKSPKKAQDNSVFIRIPDKTLKPTMMIYNFHEGGSPLTILKKENIFQIWETQDDTLSQFLNVIESVSENKIKIGEHNFIKINSAKTNGDIKILEEMLFRNEYINNATKDIIEFRNTGELIGLGSYTFYKPNYDYYDQGLQVDQVGLGKTEDDIEWFGFKFQDGALELYKLKCVEFDSTSKNCGVVVLGELTYKLWQKK